MSFRFSISKVGELFVAEHPVVLSNPEGETAYEPEGYCYVDGDLNKIEFQSFQSRTITITYRLITIENAPFTSTGLGLFLWRTPAHNALEAATIQFLPVEYLNSMILRGELQLSTRQIDTFNRMSRAYRAHHKFSKFFEIKRR